MGSHPPTATMKLFLCFALTLTISHAFVMEAEWQSFMGTFEKNYFSQQEHDLRKAIFAENLRLINQHNAEHALGLHTFTLGVNKFADMTSAEFGAYYNGLQSKGQNELDVVEIEVEDVPESVDWRTKGYVTPVKNQGSCGSCWAFSAVGAIEGAHFKKTGNLVSLSEQNLVDCDHTDHGCNGGLPSDAFEYVIKNKGIDTEKSYPYHGRQGQCKYSASHIGATISSYATVKQGSEADLKKAVATVGPISVGIDASHFSFQLYHGGVYHSLFCSSTRLDHGVLVAGYGTESGADYWLVKNSWGAGWGEKGYIKMSRNRNNNCGIATMATYPLIH